MAFSTARTQFQPPLPELASAILLAALLHRFGHTESVTFSPESPPLLLSLSKSQTGEYGSQCGCVDLMLQAIGINSLSNVAAFGC